jgi:1-acyl-sn-glycerol-3-phosphate acyltransferase
VSKAADPPGKQPAEETLLKIARQLSVELGVESRSTPASELDGRLNDDWGFDSLSRQELLLRVERAFSTTLPTRLLGDAETLRDILNAMAQARTTLAPLETGPCHRIRAPFAPTLDRPLKPPRSIGSYLYAVWWWCVLVLTGAFLWPLVLLLPTRRLRWALTRKTARGALRLMGLRVVIDGDWPEMGDAMIVANHASYLDGLVVAAVVPGEPAFIVKKEFERQVLAGPFLRRLGALFVNRSDTEAAAKGVDALIEEAKEGRVLVFMPEGTFRQTPGLLPFRLGAFVIAAQIGLRVVPLTMRGTRGILPAGQWFPRHGSVHVWIGPTLLADGWTFSAAVRLRDRVRAEMLLRSDRPVGRRAKP